MAHPLLPGTRRTKTRAPRTGFTSGQEWRSEDRREEQRDRTELTRRRRKDRYCGSSADVGKGSGPMGRKLGLEKPSALCP